MCQCSGMPIFDLVKLGIRNVPRAINKKVSFQVTNQCNALQRTLPSEGYVKMDSILVLTIQVFESRFELYI